MQRFVLTLVLTVAGWTGCQRDGSVCHRVAGLDFPILPVQAYPDQLPAGDRAIAIIGDTQRTSWQECFIGREVNDAAQRCLLRDLAGAAPGALLHVGDLVFDGSSDTHWHYFDWLMRELRETKTPILPVMGNHEYWGSNSAALERVRARFPSLRGTTTWYADRWGAVAVVALDSNDDELSSEAWHAQRTWFIETLETLDADPAVRGIIVLTHHAPYTNSPIVDPDPGVQNSFVGPFCKASKTLAMFSGHAHGYERFPRGPQENCGARVRQFVVTGGGGGPRPDELHSSADTGLNDAFVAEAPRPFNFLLVSQTGAGLHVDVTGLAAGETTTRTLESFDLEFPPQP